MKTRFKSIFALAVLVICMSSCVYSLFPIYTDDTLIYLPELEGKWQMVDDPSTTITFDRGVDIEGSITVTPPTEVSTDQQKDATDSGQVTVSIDDFSITYDGDEYIIENGDTIRDPERVKAYYRSLLESDLKEFGQAMSKTLEGMSKAAKKATGQATYKSGFESYNMTIVSGDEVLKYQVHLAQIGDDIFMDLYATDDEYTDRAFGSMVWFPVHSFMKFELENDQLTLTQFDLDKLNKLFDSNLIRMSHENVDGTILITAQPEEIQKFLKKYARDESVYDEVEVYNRIAQ